MRLPRVCRRQQPGATSRQPQLPPPATAAPASQTAASFLPSLPNKEEGQRHQHQRHQQQQYDKRRPSDVGAQNP